METGLAAPAIAAFPAVVLCIWFSTGWLPPAETVAVVGAFTSMGVMVSPLVGWFLGNVASFRINEFTATRPMTSTELADILLVNAGKSILLGWMVWWLGAGSALCCAILVGSGPTSPQALFAVAVPPTTRLQAVPYFAAIFSGTLLAGWTFASIGVALVLLRSWLFATILYLSILIPVSIVVMCPQPMSPAVALTLQVSVIMVIAMITVGVYVTAYRKRLISGRRIGITFVLLRT